MRQSISMLTMPVTVEILDSGVKEADFEAIYEIFNQADRTFSVYRPDSEMSQINRGQLKPNKYSSDMREVLKLSAQTEKETDGYFDIGEQGKINPLGIVKGWMINRAALMLREKGYKNFYIEVGGDIQADGHNSEGKKWLIGIRNPFKTEEIIKVLEITNAGVATSGSYERGEHIYNPKDKFCPATNISSLTVIGPNIHEADRFATAAFAMGKMGIAFIEKTSGLEGYAIDQAGIATLTSGLGKFTIKA